MSAINILSRNLRRLRAARKLTQEKAAERAGVTYRHYQDIEGGGRPGVRVATVERLAKAFGVETCQLLDPNLGGGARQLPRRRPSSRSRAV